MDLNLNNLKLVFTKIEGSENKFNPEGINGCNEETFVKNNPNADKSIFAQLDWDKDGYISEYEYETAKNVAGEDGILTKQEIDDACMQEMKFFARRDIDKWFKLDKNRDGFMSNVEHQAWSVYNSNGKTLNGPMSNEELSKLYGTEEINIDDIQRWLDSSIEEWKEDAKWRYGVELSEAQIIELKKEQMKQLNTWLFKTEDNENSSFYQQLNVDAYTRLLSTEDGEACCGGDICEVPDFHPSNLGKNGKYTAEEMRARLDWAENSYLVDDNGQTILKDGRSIPTKIMTPKQVETYKEMVESITGQPWDSEGWEITREQFLQLMLLINGTSKDNELLNGKTRSDIPENRQALLRFLEEKGWLYEQFQ